jgi:hypothetical protein
MGGVFLLRQQYPIIYSFNFNASCSHQKKSALVASSQELATMMRQKYFPTMISSTQMSKKWLFCLLHRRIVMYQH